MAKKFDIHKWQAEQWLKNQLNEVDIKKVVDQSMSNDDIGKLQDVIRNNNLGKTLNTIAVIVDQTGGMPEGATQMIADLVPYIDLADDTVTPEDEEFTPDLEDDELKRGAIQQMMAKEKNLNEQESEYELSDEEKDSLTDMTNGFVRKLTDVRGGNYSGDRLLAALQHVTLEIENLEPMIYDDEDEDGIPDVVDNNEEELDEANMTGTGASFNAGDGEGYATPNAFAGNKGWKNKDKKIWKEEETEEEPEEELEKDVRKIEDHPMLDKVNTKDEWEDLMQVVLDMGEEIKTVNASVMKQFLQQAIQSINKK